MIILKCQRLIKTYFGNYRNFVAWSAAIVLAVIVIDSFISPMVNRHPRAQRSRSEAGEEGEEEEGGGGGGALSTRAIAADINEQQKDRDGDKEQEEKEDEETEEEEEGGEEVEEKADAQGLRPLPPRKKMVLGEHCGLSSECPKGQFSYYVSSGYGRDGPPTICFNEQYIVDEDKANSGRGLNMVVINDVTLAVEAIRVFDVFTSDASLISYLRNEIKGNRLIMVSSQDEASFNLSRRARSEFHEFGSSVLDRVEFRDNYVIVGQRRLTAGEAIEAIEPRQETMQFAESAVVSGCMKIPIGKIEVEKQKESVENDPAMVPPPAPPSIRTTANQPSLKEEKRKPAAPEEKKKRGGGGEGGGGEKEASHQTMKPPETPKEAKEKEKAVEKEEKKRKEEDGGRKRSLAIPLGEEELNCGVKSSCPESSSSTAVRLYTGLQSKEMPRICVDGRYVLSKGLNGAGRGLNFVVFDQSTKSVTQVARFDVYNSGVNALMLFLKTLNEQEIVMAVAHDESSSGLNETVREMIESLGSSFIKRLSFRDSWAFVGQKGINGFSPYEEFDYSDADPEHQIFHWPKPIDMRICIPQKIKALSTRKVQRRNEVRRNFCRKHDGYGEFCSKENIDKMLTAKPPSDNSLSKDPIFTIVPIVVIAGIDFNTIRMQLEGLLSNPGIRTEMITVLYDESFEEASELATVFNMTSRKLKNSLKYTELMKKAIEASWTFFPNAKSVIFLEEEVIPSSDFLNFFRQCLPSVETDDTLAGISAWNDNAYEGSASGAVAYRVEMFPGLGFLLKKSFYESQMKNRLSECCMRRSWEGWNKEGMGDFEMVVPDISRVRRQPYNGRMTELLKELFRRPRTTTAEGTQVELTNANALEAEKYEAHLKELISKSRSLDQTELQRCLDKDNALYPLNNITGGPFAVFYEQETSADEQLLYSLCRCFSLFHAPKHRARGTHRGLVRFNRGIHSVFLIGSKTKYFDWKPKDVEVLQFPKKKT